MFKLFNRRPSQEEVEATYPNNIVRAERAGGSNAIEIYNANQPYVPRIYYPTIPEPVFQPEWFITADRTRLYLVCDRILGGFQVVCYRADEQDPFMKYDNVETLEDARTIAITLGGIPEENN